MDSEALTSRGSLPQAAKEFICHEVSARGRQPGTASCMQFQVIGKGLPGGSLRADAKRMANMHDGHSMGLMEDMLQSQILLCQGRGPDLA